MRKIILSVVVAGFILTLVWLVSGLVNKMSLEKHLTDRIGFLPSFSFVTLAKDAFHSSDLKHGPVLIVRFHPECEHCQYEISQLLQSDIPRLASNVLLISSAHPDSIRNFLSQFSYSDLPSIIALSDTSDSFSTIFGKDIVPSNYIYNKELKLVKVLLGEVKTETIRKYLQNSE